MKNYLVAACTPWHKKLFLDNTSTLAGNWIFIESEEQLKSQLNTLEAVEYIFFLHWRSIVPSCILNRFECVCFHMTDLPYGRGGSPLQNLIVSGHSETQVCALKMTEQLDAGPVYLRTHLLLDGSAQEIYLRAAKLSWDLIRRIIADKPKPEQQSGKVTIFKRRKPEQSKIPKSISLKKLYDHIRMLDAEDYPKAFFEIDNFKLTLSDAEYIDGELNARVVISLKDKTHHEKNND